MSATADKGQVKALKLPPPFKEKNQVTLHIYADHRNGRHYHKLERYCEVCASVYAYMGDLTCPFKRSRTQMGPGKYHRLL